LEVKGWNIGSEATLWEGTERRKDPNDQVFGGWKEVQINGDLGGKCLKSASRYTGAKKKGFVCKRRKNYDQDGREGRTSFLRVSLMPYP